MSEQPSIEEVRAEIEAARRDLAEAVDQLTDKFDVKAQASRKAHEVADKARPAFHAVQANRGPAVAAVAAVTGALILLIWRSKRDS